MYAKNRKRNIKRNINGKDTCHDAYFSVFLPVVATNIAQNDRYYGPKKQLRSKRLANSLRTNIIDVVSHIS